MKRIFLLVAVLIFIIMLQMQTAAQIAMAETLKGGAVYEVIPKGFFGVWHVTSKMQSSNNPKMFNKLSVDIWNLSGAGNVLILENAMTGAKSSIQIEADNKKLDGKTLKFMRIKEERSGKYKYIQRESPEFVLDGNIFRGFDTFIIEKYEDNKLISKDIVKYIVIGQKISGEN